MDKYLIHQKTGSSDTSLLATTSNSQASSSSDKGNQGQLERTEESKDIELTEAEEDFSDSNEGVVCKRRKRNRNVFRQKFKKTWINKDNEKWLTELPKTGEACCQVCNKSLAGGITHIYRHGASASHIKKMKAVSSSSQITTLMTETTDQKRLKDGIKKGEIKMILFLAEHNLPFRLLDHLPKFLASVCYDSELAKHLQCGRKKGTRICNEITGPDHLHQVSLALKGTWFSLIMDESTDISTQKCSTVLARYYNGEVIKDEFFGLITIESSTAESLFAATKKLLKDNNITMSRMIGFAADNAAVMQGNITGVQSKFKEEFPDIFVLGCVCHSLALCSGAACKMLPVSVEKLARDIISYFAHSSKRQNDLKEYQKFVDVSQHKLLKLSTTRWLSLQAVVNRIVEQWQALILFFTNEAYDKSSLIDAQEIVAALKNHIFKLYFTFLSYILDVVNTMNVEFQSESPKLHLLYSRITGLFKSILRNFIKPQHLDSVVSLNEIKFFSYNNKDLDDVYCGANCELIINTAAISKSDIRAFKLICLDFYIELSKQIKSRFDFNDHVLKSLQNFDIAVAVSGKCESLVPIASKFPRLVTDLEKLNSEWRLLSDMPEIKPNSGKPLMEFWNYIFNLKNGLNDYMFPNLTNFVKGILCLPHSSEAAERIFSQLSLIKVKNRNRLDIKTANSLLHTKSLLGNNTCFNFQPSQSLMTKNLLSGAADGNVNIETDDNEISF